MNSSNSNTNNNNNNRMNFLVRSRDHASKQRLPSVEREELKDDALESEALSSIRVCYRTAAASAVIDGITFNWSALRHGRSWEALNGLLGTVWKIGLATSLYRAFTIYQTNLKKQEKDVFLPVYSVCKTMARLWLEATWVLAFGCFVDLVGVFQDKFSYGGSFAIFLLAGWCFKSVSDRETQEFASVHDLEDTAAAARQMGLVTVRNMAYCSGALLARASIIPLSATYQDTWQGLMMQISGLPTPLVTGALLWQLRKSFLAALVAITSRDLQPCVRSDLFRAERSFYTKVAATFKGEATFKVGFFLFQMVVTYMKARKLKIPAPVNF
jgi:hypothetical protein